MAYDNVALSLINNIENLTNSIFGNARSTGNLSSKDEMFNTPLGRKPNVQKKLLVASESQLSKQKNTNVLSRRLSYQPKLTTPKSSVPKSNIPVPTVKAVKPIKVTPCTPVQCPPKVDSRTFTKKTVKPRRNAPSSSIKLFSTNTGPKEDTHSSEEERIQLFLKLAGMKMRQLNKEQVVFVEKLIMDALHEAVLGQLTSTYTLQC